MSNNPIKEKLNRIRFDLFIVLCVVWCLFFRSRDDREIMNTISQQVQLLEQNTKAMQSSLDSLSTVLLDSCLKTSFSGY